MLRNFDMQELAAALDAARRARSLSWVALAVEINRPFAGTHSIPISLNTVRGLRNKHSVTSAVILQILRWLRRTPESFLSGNIGVLQPSEKLPDPGPSRILRFDTSAMYAALNTERIKRNMTWREVATELPGFSESMLINLKTGPLIGFPRVMFITQWLNSPAARFVRDRSR